jgi:hypothetical protein
LKSTVSLLEQKIASFQAFPSNVIGAAIKQFYDTAVSPYIQPRTARAAAIKKLPSDQQNAAYAQFRAWRDEHDQPVTVTQGGHVHVPQPGAGRAAQVAARPAARIPCRLRGGPLAGHRQL